MRHSFLDSIDADYLSSSSGRLQHQHLQIAYRLSAVGELSVAAPKLAISDVVDPGTPRMRRKMESGGSQGPTCSSS